MNISILIYKNSHRASKSSRLALFLNREMKVQGNYVSVSYQTSLFKLTARFDQTHLSRNSIVGALITHYNSEQHHIEVLMLCDKTENTSIIKMNM